MDEKTIRNDLSYGRDSTVASNVVFDSDNICDFDSKKFLYCGKSAQEK